MTLEAQVRLLREAARHAIAMERDRTHSQTAQANADRWEAALAATCFTGSACDDCAAEFSCFDGGAPCSKKPSPAPRDAEREALLRVAAEAYDAGHAAGGGYFGHEERKAAYLDTLLPVKQP